tara:strand:- start:426 stop:821 length:396 start_codon:yes stop_codon:yes gene_type:complete
MAGETKKATKSLIDSLKKLGAQTKSYDAERKALLKKVTGREAPAISFTNLEKAYMEVIKKNDGLASAKPSTLKSIKAAEKSATKANVKAAAQALRAEVAELGKQHAKDAKFKAYQKAATDLITKISALEAL